MPFMYILECADSSYYTGSTWNLEKRLWEHQNGQGANHVAKHLPVKLVYCEEGDSIEAAYQREKQIQGWSRKKKQDLIAGDTNALHRLAQCQNDSHCRNPTLASTPLSQRSKPLALSEFEGSKIPRAESRGEGDEESVIQTGMKTLDGVLK